MRRVPADRQPDPSYRLFGSGSTRPVSGRSTVGLATGNSSGLHAVKCVPKLLLLDHSITLLRQNNLRCPSRIAAVIDRRWDGCGSSSLTARVEDLQRPAAERNTVLALRLHPQAGMNHTAPAVSVSSHVASLSSADRAAKTRNSNASLTASAPPMPAPSRPPPPRPGAEAAGLHEAP